MPKDRQESSMSRIVEEIKKNPMEYLFLRKKRKFKMDDVDVTYGDGEQSDFCIVFSPDKLETQYPIMDTKIRTGKLKPAITEFKHEYFPMSDPDVQKHVSEDIASKTVDSLNVFLEVEDWYSCQS